MPFNNCTNSQNEFVYNVVSTRILFFLLWLFFYNSFKFRVMSNSIQGGKTGGTDPPIQEYRGSSSYLGKHHPV